MEFSEITKKYWTEEDWGGLDTANSYTDLYVIAERVISKMPKPFIQVCGPISTGGLGSIPANLDMFNKTIKELQSKGLDIFDQMPFEKSMERLSKELREKGIYDHSILTDFYYPLFSSGHICAFYFMPDWESSKGARWEHDLANELGIEIVYL